jgi:predicted 3-demethylubiquinone-9 3-methyltransferase (glyoxalase superfamily)
MQLITHVNFNGNCEVAFKFYAEVLGGKVTFMMKQGESPMGDKVPAEMKDKIMHATLEVPGGGVLMEGTIRRERRYCLWAFACQYRWRTKPRLSEFSKDCPKVGKCSCNFRKRSGRRDSGCASISLKFHGWLTASPPHERRIMSFQAYIDNIKTKTGKTPEDFREIAEKKGLLKPGVALEKFGMTSGPLCRKLRGVFSAVASLGLGPGKSEAGGTLDAIKDSVT